MSPVEIAARYIAAFAAVCAAFYLMCKERKGWGWLLFIAVLLVGCGKTESVTFPVSECHAEPTGKKRVDTVQVGCSLYATDEKGQQNPSICLAPIWGDFPKQEVTVTCTTTEWRDS